MWTARRIKITPTPPSPLATYCNHLRTPARSTPITSTNFTFSSLQTQQQRATKATLASALKDSSSVAKNGRGGAGLAFLHSNHGGSNVLNKTILAVASHPMDLNHQQHEHEGKDSIRTSSWMGGLAGFGEDEDEGMLTMKKKNNNKTFWNQTPKNNNVDLLDCRVQLHQVRFYVREIPRREKISIHRRARTAVKDEEEVQQEQQAQRQVQYIERDTMDSRKQYEALTPGVKKYLQQVYSTMGAAIGIAAGGSFLTMFTGLGLVSPLVWGLGALIPMFGLTMTNPARTNLRIGMFTAFSALSGMAVGPLVNIALHLNPWAVPLALGLTAGTFFSMTMVAMMATRRSMLRWGAPLFGGLLVLMGTSLVAMFLPATSALYPILTSVWLYGGIGLFSLFIAYDTQTIINDYEEGQRDPLVHAMNMFINLRALFTHFLTIFIHRD